MSTAIAPRQITEDDCLAVLTYKELVLDGAKFTEQSISWGGAGGTEMYEIACAWVRTQTEAEFEWLRKVARSEAKGKPGTCGLTDRAAAGVLNCLVADENRKFKASLAHVATAPVVVADDDNIAAELAADEAYRQHLMSTVAQGFYTVVEDGEHHTFKLGPWKDDTYRPGQQIRWIGLLIGSDNTSDYETCARQGSNGDVTMHGMFKGSAVVAESLAALLGTDVEGHKAARLAYAMESGRCARCGRMLTVPVSLHAGLGPECLRKVAA